MASQNPQTPQNTGAEKDMSCGSTYTPQDQSDRVVDEAKSESPRKFSPAGVGIKPIDNDDDESFNANNVDSSTGDNVPMTPPGAPRASTPQSTPLLKEQQRSTTQPTITENFSTKFVPNFYYAFGYAAALSEKRITRKKPTEQSINYSASTAQPTARRGEKIAVKLPLEKLPTSTTATRMAGKTDLAVNLSQRQLNRFIMSNGDLGGLLMTGNIEEWLKESIDTSATSPVENQELIKSPASIDYRYSVNNRTGTRTPRNAYNNYNNYNVQSRYDDEPKPITLDETAAQLRAAIQKACYHGDIALPNMSDDVSIAQMGNDTNNNSSNHKPQQGVLLEKYLENILKAQGLERQQAAISGSVVDTKKESSEIRAEILTNCLHQKEAAFIVGETDTPNTTSETIMCDTPFLFEPFSGAPNWTEVATYGLAMGIHEVAVGIAHSIALTPPTALANDDTDNPNDTLHGNDHTAMSPFEQSSQPFRAPHESSSCKDLPLSRSSLLETLLSSCQTSGYGFTQGQFYAFMCCLLLMDPSEVLHRVAGEELESSTECLSLNEWLVRVGSFNYDELFRVSMKQKLGEMPNERESNEEQFGQSTVHSTNNTTKEDLFTSLQKALMLMFARFTARTVETALMGLGLVSQEGQAMDEFKGKNPALFINAHSDPRTTDEIADSLILRTALNMLTEVTKVIPEKEAPNSIPPLEALAAALSIIKEVTDNVALSSTDNVPVLNRHEAKENANGLVPAAADCYYHPPNFHNGLAPTAQVSRVDENPLRGSLVCTEKLLTKLSDTNPAVIGEHSTRISRAIRTNIGNVAIATANRLFGKNASSNGTFLQSLLALLSALYRSVFSRFFSHSYLYCDRSSSDKKAHLSRTLLLTSPFGLTAKIESKFLKMKSRSVLVAARGEATLPPTVSSMIHYRAMQTAAVPEDLFLLRQAYAFSGPLLREEAAIANSPHRWSALTIKKILNFPAPNDTTRASKTLFPSALTNLETDEHDLVKLVPVPVHWIVDQLLPWLRSIPDEVYQVEEISLAGTNSAATYSTTIFPSPIPTWEIASALKIPNQQSQMFYSSSSLQLSGNISYSKQTCLEDFYKPESDTSIVHRDEGRKEKSVSVSTSSKVSSTCNPRVAQAVCESSLYVTLPALLEYVEEYARDRQQQQPIGPFALIRLGLFQHLWTKFGGGDAMVFVAPRIYDCSLALLCLSDNEALNSDSITSPVAPNLRAEGVASRVVLQVGDMEPSNDGCLAVYERLLPHATVGDSLVLCGRKILQNNNNQISVAVSQKLQSMLLTGEGLEIFVKSCFSRLSENSSLPQHFETKWRQIEGPFSVSVGSLLLHYPIDSESDYRREDTSPKCVLDFLIKMSSPTSTLESISTRSIISHRMIAPEVDSVPGTFGFQNVGNTCFLNSTLQCLSNLKLFRETFMSLTLSMSNPIPSDVYQRRARNKNRMSLKSDTSKSDQYKKEQPPFDRTLLGRERFVHSTAALVKNQTNQIVAVIESKKAFASETRVSRQLQELLRRVWSGKGDTITRLSQEEVDENGFAGRSHYNASYDNRAGSKRAQTSVNPSSLVESFEAKAGEGFRGRQQQDAIDFLCSFLNIIRDELGSGGSGLALTGLANHNILNINTKNFKQRSLTDDCKFICRLFNQQPSENEDESTVFGHKTTTTNSLLKRIRTKLAHPNYVAEALAFWQDHLINYPSVITRLIEGQRSTTMTCLRCGHCSSTHEIFMISAIPLAETEQKYGAILGWPSGVATARRGSIDMDNFSPFSYSHRSNDFINSSNKIDNTANVCEEYCFDHPYLRVLTDQPQNAAKIAFNYSLEVPKKAIEGFKSSSSQVTVATASADNAEEAEYLSDESILVAVMDSAKKVAAKIREAKRHSSTTNTSNGPPSTITYRNTIVGTFKRRVHPRARVHLLNLIAAWLHTVYVDVELRHENGRLEALWGFFRDEKNNSPNELRHDDDNASAVYQSVTSVSMPFSSELYSTLIRLPIPTTAVDHHRVIMAGTQRHYYTHRHLNYFTASDNDESHQLFGALLLIRENGSEETPSSKTDGFLRPLNSPYHAQCVSMEPHLANEKSKDGVYTFQDNFTDFPCRLRKEHRIFQIPVLPPQQTSINGKFVWILLKQKLDQRQNSRDEYLLVAVAEKSITHEQDVSIEDLTTAIQRECSLLKPAKGKSALKIVKIKVHNDPQHQPHVFPLSGNSGSPFHLPPDHLTLHIDGHPLPWWHLSHQRAHFVDYFVECQVSIDGEQPKKDEAIPIINEKFFFDESLNIYSDGFGTIAKTQGPNGRNPVVAKLSYPFGHINWEPLNPADKAIGYSEALTFINQCANGFSDWTVVERMYSSKEDKSEPEDNEGQTNSLPLAVVYYLVSPTNSHLHAQGPSSLKRGEEITNDSLFSMKPTLLFNSADEEFFETKGGFLASAKDMGVEDSPSQGERSDSLFALLSCCHASTAETLVPTPSIPQPPINRYNFGRKALPTPPTFTAPSLRQLLKHDPTDQNTWLMNTLSLTLSNHDIPKPCRSLLDYPIRLDAQLRDGGTTIQQHPDQYQCIDCGNSSGDALFGADMTVLPPSFSVAFKRFTGNGSHFIKNDRTVDFPLKINFSSIAASGKATAVSLGQDYIQYYQNMLSPVTLANTSTDTSDSYSLANYMSSWLDRCCKGGECVPVTVDEDKTSSEEEAAVVIDFNLSHRLADMLPTLSPNVGHFLRTEIKQKMNSCKNNECVHKNGEDFPQHQVSGDNFLYALRGVVYHSGTLSGGHYTARCYNTEARKWLDYNDSHVSSCQGGEIQGVPKQQEESLEAFSSLREQLKDLQNEWSQFRRYGAPQHDVEAISQKLTNLMNEFSGYQEKKIIRPSFSPNSNSAYMLFYERVDREFFDTIIEQKDIDLLQKEMADLEAAFRIELKNNSVAAAANDDEINFGAVTSYVSIQRAETKDYHLITANVPLPELQSAILQRCAQWWWSHVTPLPKLKAAITSQFQQVRFDEEKEEKEKERIAKETQDKLDRDRQTEASMKTQNNDILTSTNTTSNKLSQESFDFVNCKPNSNSSVIKNKTTQGISPSAAQGMSLFSQLVPNRGGLSTQLSNPDMLVENERKVEEPKSAVEAVDFFAPEVEDNHNVFVNETPQMTQKSHASEDEAEDFFTPEDEAGEQTNDLSTEQRSLPAAANTVEALIDEPPVKETTNLSELSPEDPIEPFSPSVHPNRQSTMDEPD